MIIIDEEKCIGCEKCVKVCPVDALWMEEGIAELDEEVCISCSACVTACPVDAIDPLLIAKKADFSEYSDVWVFAEQHNGELRPCGIELLGKGREIADQLGEELCAVLLGKDVSDLAGQLGAYGADKVYVIENDLLDEYSTEGYTTALVTSLSKHKPSIFLLGATHLGRDLGPSVAGRLGLGLTADCTGLSITEVEGEKVLLQTRPAFGGNVMADIVCLNTRPQMATVRPHVMQPLKPDHEREYEVIEEGVKLEHDSISTRVIEKMEPEESGEIPVEEADVIVCGGRGVGDEEGFKMLSDLAGILGGTVGCSRPIVEDDIMPKSKQVGQSGKTVSPKLYIVCGVSGAIQHLVGIRGSDYIIAINKDPDAPIFEMADFGIVGDLNKILPFLTERLKKKMDN